MSKFHINDAGTVNRCNASKGQCPYGGESGSENHFDSIKEARAAYEQRMADESLKSLSKEQSLEEFSNSNTGRAKKYLQVDAEYNKVKAAHKELDGKIYGRIKKNPNYKGSDAWYRDVMQRKALYYKQLALDVDRKELLPKAIVEAELQAEKEAVEKSKARSAEWMRNNPYEMHPKIDEGTMVTANKVISAYSGLKQAEIDHEISLKMEAGQDMDSAYRELWEEVSLRKDKPIIAIDLETAAPDVRGKLDQGPYSSIIEVGFVKTYPDGRVERKSYLAGIPEDLKRSVGTGAQEVHNISPEMLAEYKPLNEDQEKTNELIRDLNGSVILAHNAKFELSQFTHNLPGFDRALKEGKMEVLDTRDVCRLFMRNTESNSNQAFVEGTGGEYKGAHRALEDAEMSWAALKRLKGVYNSGEVTEQFLNGN